LQQGSFLTARKKSYENVFIIRKKKKDFLSCHRKYFLATRIFPFCKGKKLIKKNLAVRKKLLCLYQENIFLASENISQREVFGMPCASLRSAWQQQNTSLESNFYNAKLVRKTMT